MRLILLLGFVLALSLIAPVAMAVPALDCLIKASCDAAGGETDVLHLSDLFNAHAELPSQPNYAYKVCCKAPPLTLGTDCASGGQSFLNLSAATDAHVEKSSAGNYATGACISGAQIDCGYGADCSATGIPVGPAVCLASISADTNAHVANCTGSRQVQDKPGTIIPPQGMISYWKFEEGSGTAIVDAMGGLNNGTFIKESTIPGWVNGKVGKALNLGYTAAGGWKLDYVRIKDSPSLRLSGSFTIEAWVYRDSLSAKPIVTKCDGDNCGNYFLNGYELYMNDNLKLWSEGGISGTPKAAGNTNVPIGGWHHVAVTYDSSSKVVVFYLDGKTNGTTTGVTINPTYGNYPLFLGYDGFYKFGGMLDEIAIYNRALTDSEIFQHYNGGSGADYRTCDGQWVGQECQPTYVTQSAYDTKVCCWLGDNIAPTVNIDYAGPTGDHTVGRNDAGVNEPVTFTATAVDNPGGTGVSEIKLYVDGTLRNTCASSPCIWTKNDGYAAGQSVSFYATATDFAGNLGRDPASGSKSFIVCSLGSVSITPFDCGTFGCQQGNKIQISVQYSGDTCPSPAYIQVDAAGGTCNVEAKLKPDGNGDMQGVNGSCTLGSPCTTNWILPAVPSACEGQTVTATAASIRDKIDPTSWRLFGLITNPVGSFTIRGGLPSLIRVYASTEYVKHNDPVTIYSETSGGVGNKRLDCTSGGYGLCSATAASNPSCDFNSPWTTDGEKIVQCWVYDEGTGKFSDTNKTLLLESDNTPPLVRWDKPELPAYVRDGASVTITAGVTDPNIQVSPIVPGAGVLNGVDCNISIDYKKTSFTNSVLYNSSTQSCNGTISLNNPSGLTDGNHTISMDIYDNVTNHVHVERNLTIDNTPPQAWIKGLPVWKNASSAGTVTFPVNWGGTDQNSPTGGALTFNVQYAVFDSSGGQEIGWTDFVTWTGNWSKYFGPTDPLDMSTLEKARVYEGKNISFSIKVTDQAGNYQTYGQIPYPLWGTVIDTTPPSCSMGTPSVIATGNNWNRNGFWFVNGRYNVPWGGTDTTPSGGVASGAASYDVNMLVGASWSNINNILYCNNTGLTSSACEIGANGQIYNFSCRTVDNAGNIGAWASPNVSVKVDTQPPMSFFNPLHEWMGRHQSEWLGSEYFNLSWNDNIDPFSGLDDFGGSGVKCFYVRWSNYTTRADADPAKRWINLASGYNADPACLSPTNRSYKFGLYNLDTILRDDEKYNFSIKSVDNIGNWEEWNESGTDARKVKNTTIDRYNPIIFSWVKDSTGRLVQPGYLDPAKTIYVNITSNASDNISGIHSNIIYLTIIQRNLNNYISTSSSPSNCVGGNWNASDHGGNITCTVKVDYAEGTTINYNINATDRANNTNSTTGVVTTHPLVNFLVHLAVMSLGATADIPAQVRNLESTTQNLTLGLEGFSAASFLPADELAFITPCSTLGRCANITLSPGEQRTIYVRLMANDITSGAEGLNISAISNPGGVVDNDTASIVVGYPAEFPALDAWWAVLLMMVLAAVMFYRTEASVKR